jgi:hypothetical protein
VAVVEMVMKVKIMLVVDQVRGMEEAVAQVQVHLEFSDKVMVVALVLVFLHMEEEEVLVV